MKTLFIEGGGIAAQHPNAMEHSVVEIAGIYDIVFLQSLVGEIKGVSLR